MREEPGRPRFVAGAMGPTTRTASLSPDVADPGARRAILGAAQATACMGVSTRVETTVAIELAAS